jgi:hypothetical protein
MLRSRLLLAVALAAGLAAPAAAQDKVDLAWKFEKDKVFFQEMVTTTTQNMKVQGLSVDQTQKQTFYFSWKATEEKADKSWVLTQRIEGVKMEITIAGNQITYDSTATTPQNNPLADFFSKLVGSEFKVTVGPDRKVTSVDAGGFVDKLKAANPQMEPLIKQILNENALKQMADPTFGMVPPPGKGPVGKGDTWERTAELNLGPIGSYKNTYKYTYDGKEKRGEKELDKIKVDISMAYSAPTAGGDALPFRIKEANLKSKDSGGTIFFDSKAGRLEDSDLKLELNGDLTIDIGGTSNKVELKQIQQTTIKTLEKLPFEPKKAG